jgi:hypothetical protein
MILHKGRVKQKLLSQISRSIASKTKALSNERLSYSSLSALSVGQNIGKVINVAMITANSIAQREVPPESFISVDEEGAFCLVSIYQLASHAVKFSSGQLLAIQDPLLIMSSDSSVSVSAQPLEEEEEDKEPFRILQVHDLSCLLVDGKPIDAKTAVPRLKIETFDP